MPDGYKPEEFRKALIDAVEAYRAAGNHVHDATHKQREGLGAACESMRAVAQSILKGDLDLTREVSPFDLASGSYTVTHTFRKPGAAFAAVVVFTADTATFAETTYPLDRFAHLVGTLSGMMVEFYSPGIRP